MKNNQQISKNNIGILSIDELLGKKLDIPNYQRPYKWTKKNIIELLLDIQKSIEDSKKYKGFKYRIGTIILYENKNEKEIKYEVVDGQQRILSLLLLKRFLRPDFTCALKETKFSDKTTQENIRANYKTIKRWFVKEEEKKEEKKAFENALANILEVVVITVHDLSEAFQLFDSQNTRGRALYPHDLLKA